MEHRVVLCEHCVGVRQRRIDAENSNGQRSYNDDEDEQQQPVNSLCHRFPLVLAMSLSSELSVPKVHTLYPCSRSVNTGAQSTLSTNTGRVRTYSVHITHFNGPRTRSVRKGNAIQFYLNNTINLHHLTQRIFSRRRAVDTSSVYESYRTLSA